MTEIDVPQIEGCLNLRLIGRGGFSRVYRAEQPSNNRLVAVKVLALDLGKLRKQFQKECQAAGRLSTHPNIITLLESGLTSSNEPYLMMDYHAEGSLGDRLAARGALEVDQVLRVGVAIAGALETAHEQNFLHRDVKPENILISEFGEPILADFGIATVIDQLTRTSLVDALTPTHAAPELFEDAEPTVSADVYSLASTLYMLLAGRPAFTRRPGEGVLSYGRRVTEDPVSAIPRSDVPAALFSALVRAMAKDPKERPASAREVAFELQSVQRALGLPVTKATMPASPGRQIDPSVSPGAGPDTGLPEFGFDSDPPHTSGIRRRPGPGDDPSQPAHSPLFEASPVPLPAGDTIMSSRQRHARPSAPRAEDEAKRGPLALAAGVGIGAGVVVGAVVLAVVLLGSKPNHPASQGGSTSASTTANAGPPLLPPDQVMVNTLASGLYQVEWRDPNPTLPAHQAVVLVSFQSADGTVGAMIGASTADIVSSASGVYSAEVSDAGGDAALLNPDGYCFSIGLYDSSPTAVTSALVSQSPQVCPQPGSSTAATGPGG